MKHFRSFAAPIALALVSLPKIVFADTISVDQFGINSSPSSVSLSSFDIPSIAVNVIRLVLGIAAFGMILQLVYGGFLMMSHDDSDDAKDEAIEMLKNSGVALVIIITSMSLTKTVIDTVNAVAQNYL